MIKAIIFDADGVLVHREKYFSQILEDDYGIPRSVSLNFFNGEFTECLVGKKDLKEILPKYLKEWGWKKSLEELLKYWFETESKTDQQILEYITKLKAQGIKILIGTNNEKYRTEYLRDMLGLGKISHKVYGSGHIGFAKPDINFFRFILEEQKLDKKEVLFWDDDEENVASAKKIGIKAHIYTNFVEFKKKMDEYLIE